VGNVLFAGFLVVFGIVYYQGSTEIPRNMLEDPVGASGFPRALAIVITLLAIALLVQELLAWRRRATAFVEDNPRKSQLHELKPVLLLLATLTAFLFLFDTLGYILSIILLLLAVFFQNRMPLGWKPIAVAIGGAIAFQLMFGAVLGVRLPLGPLEFFISS
jgi:putative tricarboxylic transport membrane protein